MIWYTRYIKVWYVRSKNNCQKWVSISLSLEKNTWSDQKVYQKTISISLCSKKKKN